MVKELHVGRGTKPQRWPWACRLALLALTRAQVLSSVASDPPTSSHAGSTNSLTLRRFVQLLLESNESLQSKVLEFESSRKKYRSECGVFEPELVLSYDRVENQREDTAEQRRSSG